MVKSSAETVEDYISDCMMNEKNAIVKRREITEKTLLSFQESMRFGMPTYDRKKQVFGFASQKNYIGFYVNTKMLWRNTKKNCVKLISGRTVSVTANSDINFDHQKRSFLSLTFEIWIKRELQKKKCVLGVPVARIQ